jgi:dihydropteroate synthase
VSVASLRLAPVVAVLAFARGASLFRVHDVRQHVEALAAARAVVGP